MKRSTRIEELPTSTRVTGLTNIMAVRTAANSVGTVDIHTGSLGTGTTIVNVTNSNLSISSTGGSNVGVGVGVSGAVNIIPGTQITAITNPNITNVALAAQHQHQHHRIPTQQQQNNTASGIAFLTSNISHVPMSVATISSARINVNETVAGVTGINSSTVVTNAGNLVQVAPANGNVTGGSVMQTQSLQQYANSAYLPRIQATTLKAINASDAMQIQTSAVSGPLSIIPSGGASATVVHNNVIRQRQTNIISSGTVITAQPPHLQIVAHQQQQTQPMPQQQQQPPPPPPVHQQQLSHQMPQTATLPTLVVQPLTNLRVQTPTTPIANGPSSSGSTVSVAQSITSSTNANGNANQRLKVEDALSYLDQVKLKYHDNPQTYNNFLDIMKEFKSHTIDTPGVIARVSTLFEGHNELIQGFNMFLPPGYRIDVDNNTPILTTPTTHSTSDRIVLPPPPPACGNSVLHSNNTNISNASTLVTLQSTITTAPPIVHLSTVSQQVTSSSIHRGNVNTATRAADGNVNMSQAMQHTIQVPAMSPSTAPYISASNAPAPVPVANITATPHYPQNYSRDRERSNLTPNRIGSPSITNSTTAASAACNGRIVAHSTNSATPVHAVMPVTAANAQFSDIGRQNLSHIHEAAQLTAEPSNQQLKPVEFNHAITYVNKIKSRFQEEPAKYKQFLEILHKYQRDQKSVNSQGVARSEQVVYDQVVHLFQHDADLLTEFRQFLPETQMDENYRRISSPMPYNSPQRLSNETAVNVLSSLSPANVGAVGGVKTYNNAQQNNLSNQLNAAASASNNPYERNYRHNANASGSLRQNQANIINALSFDKDNHRNNQHGYNQQRHFGQNSPNIGSVSGQQPQQSQQQSYNVVSRDQRVLSPMQQQHHLNVNASAILERPTTSANCQSLQMTGIRRNIESAGFSDESSPKRFKTVTSRHVSQDELRAAYTITDAALFDKIRQLLDENVYNQFLRLLTLFNNNIMSSIELRTYAQQFLSKDPEVWRDFCTFLIKSRAAFDAHAMLQSGSNNSSRPNNQAQNSCNIREADPNDLKRLESYCFYESKEVCSGRTTLCNEVLNDTWRSCPKWGSEDTTGVNPRKNNFEDNIFRTEDERFELDMVIELNRDFLKNLNAVEKSLNSMSAEELMKFRLKENLNGTSTVNNKRALRRIYGDRADDIMRGLMQSPQVAVPLVVKRLREKDTEWKAAQKNFNKQWAEVVSKFYLKSLDHQSVPFKINDTKSLRAKNLTNEIKTLYNNRLSSSESGPHLNLLYRRKFVLANAADLLIYHVKRQTSIQKQEKQRIKQVLRQFLPDLFQEPRQELSDDERDDEMDAVSSPSSSEKSAKYTPSTSTAAPNTQRCSNSPRLKHEAKSPNYFSTSDTGNAVSATVKSLELSTQNTTTPPPINSATEITSPAAPSVPTSSTFCANTNSNKDSKSAIIKSSSTNNHCDSSPSIVASSSNCSNNAPKLNESSATTTEAQQQNTEVKQEFLEPSINQGSLPAYAVTGNENESYTLFMGNKAWYTFIRLHAILCERLAIVFDRAQALIEYDKEGRETKKDEDKRGDIPAIWIGLRAGNTVPVAEYYTYFLNMVKSWLDGNTDANSFEDKMRAMFGVSVYQVFTLDKVINNAVRHLQTCVTESNSVECVEHFRKEFVQEAAGGLCRHANRRYVRELAYQRKMEEKLRTDECLKFYIYKIDCRVTIELLDTGSDEVNNSPDEASTGRGNHERSLKNISNYDNAGDSPRQSSPIDNDDNRSEPMEYVTSECAGKRFLLRNKRRSPSLDEFIKQLPDWRQRTFGKSFASSDTGSASSSRSSSSGGASSNRSQKTLKKINDAAFKKYFCIDGRCWFPDGMSKDKLTIKTMPEKLVTFIKAGFLGRTRLNHRTIAKSKYKRFANFHNNWLKKNVTPAQQQRADLLLGCATTTTTTIDKSQQQQQLQPSIDNHTTQRLIHNSLDRPPYRSYNSYKVLPLEPKATSSTSPTATVQLKEVVATTPTSNTPLLVPARPISTTTMLTQQITSSRLVVSTSTPSAAAVAVSIAGTPIAMPAAYASQLSTLFAGGVPGALAVTPILSTPLIVQPAAVSLYVSNITDTTASACNKSLSLLPSIPSTTTTSSAATTGLTVTATAGLTSAPVVAPTTTISSNAEMTPRPEQS